MLTYISINNLYKNAIRKRMAFCINIDNILPLILLLICKTYNVTVSVPSLPGRSFAVALIVEPSNAI